MSLHDSAAHIKGKLNEFILEQIGSVEFNPDTLYKTIVEECRTRSKYTGIISSFSDLIQKKSITRSQVEGWLDLVRKRQALPEWSTISQQLSVGAMELANLTREWQRYRAIALDAGNEAKRDQVQRSLSDLHSNRAALIEQSSIAGNALAELDADYEFIRKTADAEIICPTCGTAHLNDFANKFGLISDAETCRGFLLEVRREIAKADEAISLERAKFENLTQNIERINAILNEQRGELKLRDLVEGESERMVDDAIAAEQSDINTKIGEQDARSDEAQSTMKSFEDKKFQKTIKDRYFQFMRQFIFELQVPGLPEKSYKQIDCVINETGSDLPRALLAYYYAFANTMRASSASVLCPLIVDSPVQQDQDPANATRIMQFALEHVPDDMQLILGSVSLHGAAYDGHSIEIEGKRNLLQSDAYDEASGIMKPFYDALIRPQASP